jgi:hypothetical protein
MKPTHCIRVIDRRTIRAVLGMQSFASGTGLWVSHLGAYGTSLVGKMVGDTLT